MCYFVFVLQQTQVENFKQKVSSFYQKKQTSKHFQQAFKLYIYI